MSTFQGFLHPHHVSLTRQPYSLQTLFQSVADRVDPIYVYGDKPPHRAFSAPRFNVAETETNYVLEGELPGVRDKESINVVWLQNQVLVVHGTIDSAGATTAARPAQSDEVKDANIKEPAPLNGKPPAESTGSRSRTTFPRQLLQERHIGPFERSFTFPGEVGMDDMKASLTDGLLRIVVPKKIRSASSEKRVPVE
jgi:HSP20 family molecular chaperone IbpA